MLIESHTTHNLMCKCAARENIVGFYSSGPKIKGNDIEVNHQDCKLCYLIVI